MPFCCSLIHWKKHCGVPGRRLPDAWKLVIISASAMSFCDMSVYVFYIAMMKTSYGCEFDRLNARIMGIWSAWQIPAMFISARLVDGFPKRSHVNIVLYGITGFFILWISYFFNSVAMCVITYVAFSLVSQMINVASTKIVKQRLEVFYGCIGFVEQDAEYTRISPWSDVVDSSIEMLMLLLTWHYLSQDPTGVGTSRTAAYIIESIFLYGIVTLPLTYNRKDLITSYPSLTDLDSVAGVGSVGRQVGFSLSKFFNGVSASWTHSLESFHAMVRCKPAMHALFRNLFFGVVMVLVGMPVTFTQSKAGNESSAPCGGAMLYVFQVGIATEVTYTVGAFIYLLTISGMHPKFFYSYVYPVCGLVMLACTFAMYCTNAWPNLNSVIIAVVSAMSYYFYEFDLCCGLSAIPQEHSAFYFSIWSIVAILPYVLYYFIEVFDRVNDQAFLLVVVAFSIAVTIVHSFVFAWHSKDELTSSEEATQEVVDEWTRLVPGTPTRKPEPSL